MVTKIRDLPVTAASVTDLDGIGIQGSDSAQNISPAFKGTGAMLGRMNSGADALDDTVTYCDPDDNTKLFRSDAGDIPSGTTRILNVERQSRQGAEIITRYTASGTHTFSTASRYFQIEGCGGGGGGGGCDGQSIGTIGIAGGGSSGYYGETDIIARNAILTGTIVIGTGGAGGAGASGGNGTNGVDTTWSDGVNSFNWGKGLGGKGAIASSDGVIANGAGAGTHTGTLYGISREGEAGNLRGTTTAGVVPEIMKGGKGGNTPLGEGGSQTTLVGASPAVGGDATGYGAGGGGASVAGLTTNYAGGAGAPGILIVREW